MAGWDVIVVGGGHAGCEAASVAARHGARTLLVTHARGRIGELSCNPAVGGIGKGHLVREIDALDGLIGRVADRAGIHFKLLNRSRGAAVQGPRVQVDRGRFRAGMQALLSEHHNLDILDGSVADLLSGASDQVTGVTLEDGRTLEGGAVVLTTGTFLGGRIHLGRESWPAGRVGDPAAETLARRLAARGLRMGRLKTGTPARIARASIDWENLPVDPGDGEPEMLSTLSPGPSLSRVACRITRTTTETHDIIRRNLDRSALYGGDLIGTGPRYCPSIEDKVVRFTDRDSHQIFLEPEGLPDGPDGALVYPNGLSTSLPADVQQHLIRSMPGLGEAEIVRPGYAIEYDYVDPRQLDASLQLPMFPRLFLAGQINGTTGYEEAAAQGLVAGLNAARLAGGADQPATFGREEAYLGVLVDDLITSGVSEPYRMFTSRAEYRLALRADNADLRLTRRGITLGIVGLERAASFASLEQRLESASAAVAAVLSRPNKASAQARVVESANGTVDDEAGRILASLEPRIARHLRAEVIYGGFRNRQAREIAALAADRAVALPPALDYHSIGGLSAEMCERLERVRPQDFAQAKRIPGLSPAALLALLHHVRRGRTRDAA